ncbi:MarC family protein [Sedimentitalea xiamensis]|uniref:MarC family protein n=1 Tax=Sedimentitalea xiamensis TaxID=3050037 RepID=UPI002AA2A6EE|nr:MarC family protein [Sedimentitalea xiamensis]
MLAVKFFGALFAIMNPITNLPIFLSLTEGEPAAVQRKVAVKVVVYSLIMGAVIAAAGPQVLKLFGITVDDMRVAGGLVVLKIGLDMLQGSGNASHHGSQAEQANYPDPADVAFYPMAFPMIIGPGTITTLIVFFGQADTAAEPLALAVVFLGVLGLLGVVLFFAGALGQWLSDTARVIMGRLMGMILAAIAVEMIATGLKALLPGLT